MFDIGWQELFILAVLAIIVIGPKDLPRAIGTITKWIRKARSMARDLQDGLDEVAREADLDDFKKELALEDGTDIAKRLGDTVDPTGEITKDMDLDKDVYDEMSDAVDTLKETTAPKAKAGDAKKAKAGDAKKAKAGDTNEKKAEPKAASPDPSDTPKKADGSGDPDTAKKADG